jgi:cyclic beta-1,2-glucan synthetase
MKKPSEFSSHIFEKFLRPFRHSPDSVSTEPLREEVFSVEGLEQYASVLAEELTVYARSKKGRSLNPIIEKHSKDLNATYKVLAEAIREQQPVSPAAEWIVDNYHVIEEQLRDIRLHLPPQYYNGLPKLSSGPLKDYPRVYAIALSFLAHTDCRLDTEALRRFVDAFQKIAPLSIGELWALSISLRIALVDFLKPIALRVLQSRSNRERANEIADNILLDLKNKDLDSDEIVSILAQEMGDSTKFDRALVVQLVQRLRDQDPDVWPIMEWIEKELEKSETNSQKIIQLEHKRQAAAQVTVGNILGSMRLLSVLDWRDFFEKVSLVDRILGQDPAGAYINMEFRTRDNYRHTIETMASRCQMNELEVAQSVLDLALEASGSTRSHHIGYFLIGEGRDKLEAKINYKPRLRQKITRLLLSHSELLYLGSVGLMTTLTCGFLVAYLQIQDSPPWLLLVMGLLVLLPSSEFSIGLINHYVTLFLRPSSLPKMDTSLGIPLNAKTMVVVPTLFTSEKGVRELVDSLHVNFIANRDDNVYFALLGDFGDADQEQMPEDKALIELALSGLEQLNAHYFPNGENHFFLFARNRRWNASEEKWIGWERKRGKLEEFNFLLRGGMNTSYAVATASLELLKTIKYVITLDSDTRLPRDSARRMVGTIIHPLNLPVFDSKIGRVTQGYGVLQPRVSISLSGSFATRFVRIFAGHTGLDPYTTAVSDVYQDLFLEGSFTGKGLYDVDMFQLALENRVPENHILSHDLFEGSFARSALLSDVEIFDDFPTNFDVYVKRLHRWTRGDWQIARWIWKTVPNARLEVVPNALSTVSKWKIFDNLRRSLILPAFFLCFVISWLYLPEASLVWSLALFLLLFLPSYVPVTDSFLGVQKGIFWKGHFRSFRVETQNVLIQVFFTLVFLPELAWTQIDAITRTFYRKYISHKKLLEWTSFAQSQKQFSHKTSWWNKVGPSPLFAFATVVLMGFVRPESYGIAAPFVLLWFMSPFIKYWLSQVPKRNIRPLGKSERDSYRQFACLTWNYFETFVSSDGNWLAPDNFQEDPFPVVAHRTSPTNIGLQLLATCSAKDLGYIGLFECVEILERTFLNLKRLERLHGHFFNWYDTQTQTPLSPRYISTVDSGNLAGHLLATKQCCAEWIKDPFPTQSSRQGLIDTIRILISELQQEESHSKDLVDLESDLVSFSSASPSEWVEILQPILSRLIRFSDLRADSRSDDSAEIMTWLRQSIKQIREIVRDDRELSDSSSRAQLQSRLHQLIHTCDELFDDMDFSFLYDNKRKTFVIGYNVHDERKDNSYYDLLASESRLASFIAISKGDVSQEHWFHLGRPLTKVKGGRALISWTGTMFEYFMPLLVMEDYEDTLLCETYKSVLARQMEYGKKLGVPWGISEAAYHARDLQLNYQYGPFGVPGLGLKRGLSDDLVVSPYSSMLAAMLDPWKALDNLLHLKKMGMLSRYGFFESIDFTPERMPPKQKSFILKSFMAHHQGMSLVAINNILNDSIMQRRFHADALVQSSVLLLQEKIPQEVPLSSPREEEVLFYPSHSYTSSSSPRIFTREDLFRPRTQLLSNGTYSVMVGASGSGYSRCGKLAINRWREDATQDNWGQHIYIRNRSTQSLWSAGFLPTAAEPNEYQATFSEDRVDIRRSEENIDTHTEIIVSPEDNVELRRVSLINHSTQTVEIEVTSYFEAVFAPHLDDVAHPAFSNLFVQTEFVAASNALVATRRKRSDKESDVCGFHVVFAEGSECGVLQYETDRSRFLGRGRSCANPIVIDEQRPLSNTTGSVLDPIFALRRVLRLRPGETSRVCFATGVANSHEEALHLCDKYHDPHIFSREAELVWTQAQVHLRHLNISSRKAQQYQALASHIVYSNSSLRPRPHVLAQNTQSQAGLWAYGISGDLPIVLSSVSDEKDLLMVRELLHAHEYLRLKGLIFDLVIINERAPSYFQSLQDELQKQIRICGSKALLDKSGGVFLRRSDIIPEKDLLLLRTSARVILRAGKGTLSEQLKRINPTPATSPFLIPKIPLAVAHSRQAAELRLPELSFFNGLGGFAAGGKEYCIFLKDQQWTPAPWINVIANKKDFGFIVSEAGSGYTWSQNSRENRLTPWSNDAVGDPSSECVYLRDEESAEFWSPTPLPIRNKEAYLITHARGSTRFEHICHELHQSLEVFVAPEDSVKITRVKIKNLGQRVRSLSITSFVEWTLGFSRGSSAPFVITEIEAETQAILARNPYNNEFSSRIAFHQISEIKRDYTCDRHEFIGSHRSLARPQALERSSLLKASGAGLDPCGVLQHKFSLAPNESKEFFILLGQGENMEEVNAILQKFSTHESVEKAFQETSAYWDYLLAGLKIDTPDEAMNILVNNWLLYQTLSCRVWARSAFYQSGGAYGFRDQLQDVMALVYNSSDVSREHILRAAGRQFPEGDVQHWWHPPTGRGVRTRFSDDLLWLPYVTSFYVKNTGDASILNEETYFIEAPLLSAGIDDFYTLPANSRERVSLLEHCARTIDRSLKVGEHGLPLMGSGDWNDGMSQVGPQGRGESVWVAWFLHSTIEAFLPYLERESSQVERVTKYKQHLIELRKAVELHAWDGDWYRRAYFDDGTPLGSSSNDECRIDSIAQSWSVLSGAGNVERSKRAMAAVDELLIDRGDGLIKLFTPPFDKGKLNPGYIKGYVPGVRENGGQYTHAALWTLMAFAKLGDGDKAAELYALLNPINHSSTRAGLHKYKVEPYVAAADIYGLSPHVGRGGWTWYTGSASWMYRAAIESLLGFELRGQTIHLQPRVPSGWSTFSIDYRWRSSLYKISLRRHPEAVPTGQTIELVDDGQTHEVEILFN